MEGEHIHGDRGKKIGAQEQLEPVLGQRERPSLVVHDGIVEILDFRRQIVQVEIATNKQRNPPQKKRMNVGTIVFVYGFNIDFDSNPLNMQQGAYLKSNSPTPSSTAS